MFNLFKKCENCKEHNDLERLRELNKELISLQAQIEDLEKASELKNSAWYTLCSFNYRRYEAPDDIDKLGERIKSILSPSQGLNYDEFRKGIHPFLIDALIDYLNGYVEYKDRIAELRFRAKLTKDEITEIKERLGIE